jgi:hypothetical protein
MSEVVDKVRVIFPLLMTGKGKPRSRQGVVVARMGPNAVFLKRGVVVEMPPEFLSCFAGEKPGSERECFISISGGHP